MWVSGVVDLEKRDRVGRGRDRSMGMERVSKIERRKGGDRERVK